jgi:hypothetical protein
MNIRYLVQWVDWLANFPPDDDEEAWENWNNSPDNKADVSDKIDVRTERSKSFDTEDAAFEFAKQKLQEHANDKWLAYIVVKKSTTELLVKLK